MISSAQRANLFPVTVEDDRLQDIHFLSLLKRDGHLLGMIVALSLIFVGVKRYRDRGLGGVIKFLPAFLMGLAIAAVASVIYVLVWEVYMAATDGAFFDVYMQAYIDGEKAKGLSGAALDKLIADMEAMKTQYNSSQLFRVAITFTEIFPVGFVIALISAALLQFPKILPARA